MKKIRLTLLLLLFCGNACVQKNEVINYRFVENGYFNVPDSVSKPIHKGEHHTQREYLNPTTFTETLWFTGSDSLSYLYKIENGIWYYRNKKEWQLFYNFNTKKGGYFEDDGDTLVVQFKKSVTLRNEILHKIELEKIGYEISHYASYYFSPTKGIIILNTNNGSIYLRSDCFSTPLTEKELNLL